MFLLNYLVLHITRGSIIINYIAFTCGWVDLLAGRGDW